MDEIKRMKEDHTASNRTFEVLKFLPVYEGNEKSRFFQSHL